MRFTVKGEEGQIKSLFNAIEASPNCISIRTLPAHKHRDGETVTQTFVCEMTEAKRYAERKEKPLRRDRAGWCYLFETPHAGIYKLGHAADMQDRKAIFNVKLPFDVKLVHCFWEQDRYAAEADLKRLFAKQKKRMNGSEFYALTPMDVAYFCSL